MKKLFIGLLLLTSLSTVAQEDKKNEFKINAAYILAGYPELAYERILTEETAFGVAAGVDLERGRDYIFSVLPYYRIYFGKERKTSGFFIEGNGAFYAQNYRHYMTDDLNNFTSEIRSESALGLGFAVGAKFLTKEGWVGEIIAGGGRNFINTDEIPKAYPRFGLMLGKRF